jgi:hypothetical protein
MGKVFDGSEEDFVEFMKESGYDLHSKVGIDGIFVKRKKA